VYEGFFGLEELPFSLSPDPRFLWLSETHLEGLSVLEYGITQRKGFLLLTGEVGVGKTTLLRAVLDRIPQDTDVGLVMNTAGLEPIDLFKLIAAEFRLSGPFDTKGDYIIALNRFLIDRLRCGLSAVLIIDEAQNLDPHALEEVRLLSNLETDREKLLQIVLTGQPELRRILASPALRPLRQRVAVEHHVEPLRAAEISPYLDYRITSAGGRCDRVFSPGAEPIFYEFSKGCPRLVNLLADRVLLSAFVQRVRPVPPALIERKAKEMAARPESAPECAHPES
jgi:general secretion pathway protein A